MVFPDGRRVAKDAGNLSIPCFAFCRSACTVEVDDEDGAAERTDEEPCSSSAILLVGLFDNGLACRKRGAGLLGSATPGEYDDIEVGVDDMLNRLGDSEYPVDGVVEGAY